MNSYRGNERLEGGSDWPEAIRLLVSGQTWTVGLLRAQASLPAARYRKDLFDSLTHIPENTENAGSGSTKHSVRGLTLAAVLCARLSWRLVATQDQRCSLMCSRPGCGKLGHVLLGKIEGIINKKDGAGLWAQGGGGWAPSSRRWEEQPCGRPQPGPWAWYGCAGSVATTSTSREGPSWLRLTLSKSFTSERPIFQYARGFMTPAWHDLCQDCK